MRRRLGSGLLFAACVLGTGCDQTRATPTAASGAPSAPAPSSATAAPSASAAPPAARPWFAGSWTGKYAAQHYRIEAPKHEGARAWGEDDGGAHTGEGTIHVTVSETGAAQGAATGPLGEQRVSGEVDRESLRLQLAPKQPGPRSFGGVLLLSRSGQTLEGRLQASSGDSLVVRDALVALSRGDAGTD